MFRIVYLLLDDNLDGSVTTKEGYKCMIKLWYDGYINGDQRLYNPWSIMQCLKHHTLDSYWLNTGEDSMLREALNIAANNEHVNTMLQDLLRGQIIDTRVDRSYKSRDLHKPSSIWHLALHSGYLTAKRWGLSCTGGFDCALMIPNFEVKTSFKSIFIEWVQQCAGIDSSEFSMFLETLLIGDVDTFQLKLNDYLSRSVSFHQAGDKNTEVFYNGLMHGLLMSVSKTHTIESERESGRGRLDCILVPRENQRKFTKVIIIEYKTAKTEADLGAKAQIGLDQIQNSEYGKHLEITSHITHIVKVAIAFYKKQACLKSVTDVL